jgi:hypothetical protein
MRLSVSQQPQRCSSAPELLLLGCSAKMSEPSLSRKGRLTAVCMFVCSLIIIGLAVTGVLQLRWAARSPVAHIVAK